MTWRPWIVGGALIVALLVNGLLLVQEEIIFPNQGPDTSRIDERLKTLQYLAAQRRANFQKMGMDFEMAEAAANAVSRFQGEQRRYEALLDEQAAELVDVFCPRSRLPQPYLALGYLVTEENGVRSVVEPRRLARLVRQPWWEASLVPALYDQFERAEDRKEEATLMAISATLLDREADALRGVRPWSIGMFGGWGFALLQRKEPRIESLAIDYFALMHFLTELANTPEGICS